MRTLDPAVARHRVPRGQRVRPPGPVGLLDGLTYCLKVFLSVRIGLSVVALVAVAILPDLTLLHGPEGYSLPGPVGVPGWPAHAITPGWHNLVTAWERFDGLWYLHIAASGYANHDGSAAFFPLYPMAIRAISFVVGGHELGVGLFVSNVCFLASLVVLYALTARELSVEAARRAVLYTAIFPTAFFFVAPYSESLFLLLVLLTFWWARERRWAAAGLAAMLAALTRNLGVLLVVPLAVEAVLQAREDSPGSRDRGERAPRSWRPLWGRLGWSLAPVAGAGLYLWFWQRLSGDWLAPIHQQASWERKLQNPVLTVAKGTHEAFRWIGNYPGGYHLLDWLIAVPVLVGGVVVLARYRFTYGAYVGMSLLAPLSFIFAGRPLMSLPRFALPLFPVFWAFAVWTERSRPRHEAYLVASALLLSLMLLLFVNWFYVF